MISLLRHVAALAAGLLFLAPHTRAFAQMSGGGCTVAERDEWAVVSTDPTLLAGIDAARTDRLEEAAALLRQAVRTRETEAQASYLLAKLSLDDRVDDPAGASRYIKRAIALEPENVRFIEERLRQVNSGKPFFMGSDADTYGWANRILRIDSLDASAYAALGLDFLGQYHRYDHLMDTNRNTVLAGMTADVLAKARRNLEEALTLDPCRRETYDHLMRLNLETRQYNLASELALYMQRHFPADPTTWLYSGTAAFFEGRADEAKEMFDKGLILMDADLRAAFIAQDYLLTEEERIFAFQTDDFFDVFWEGLRPRYLTEANERLLAHYARLTYADLFFPYWRRYVEDDWQYSPGEFVLRWGIPTGDFSYLDYGESGMYALGRNLLIGWPPGSITFTDFTRNGEYLIVDVVGTSTSGQSTHARNLKTESPQHYEHDGGGRVVEVPYLVSVLKREDRRDDASSADVVISLGLPLAPSDSNMAAYGRILDEANRETLNGVYLTLGSFLIDGAYDVAAEKRQTYYGLPSSGLLETSGGTLWATTHTHSAPPGPYRVSVEFETLSKDVLGFTRADIDVPVFSADSLLMSDLVLAYSVENYSAETPVSSNIVRRNDLSIEPSPWGVYAADQPIYVYFEMYNLSQSALGSTDAEIQIGLVPSDAPGEIAGFFNRLFGGEEEGVAVSSTFAGSSRDDNQYVIVDASEQEPGEYELVLRVRDLNTGSVQEKRRTIVLDAPLK